jgi:molybdate transport system ATP-binding protein
MTASLELDVALERGAFSLRARERIVLEGITALFGPSGSGKTTLLRVIAGLEKSATGRVAFDDAVWQGERSYVPPHRRAIGYVFQDARLFPHLDVERNLRFFRRPAVPVRIAFADVVAALDLSSLLDRRPLSLSGGEQQRVAIGRALLSQPRLLLMDEPLSSLDARRKREILPYIEQLPTLFDVPVLYVTHNLDEVARLASEVWLLADGRTVVRGKVADVLERIDLWPVTGRLEAGTVLEARVEAREAGMATLSLGRQTLRVPMDDAATPPRASLRIRIHARDVAIATQPPRHLSIRNVLSASILRIDLDATVYAELLLEVDEQHLRARITREALEELGMQQGQQVYALIKSVVFEGL